MARVGVRSGRAGQGWSEEWEGWPGLGVGLAGLTRVVGWDWSGLRQEWQGSTRVVGVLIRTRELFLGGIPPPFGKPYISEKKNKIFVRATPTMFQLGTCEGHTNNIPNRLRTTWCCDLFRRKTVRAAPTMFQRILGDILGVFWCVLASILGVKWCEKCGFVSVSGTFVWFCVGFRVF